MKTSTLLFLTLLFTINCYSQIDSLENLLKTTQIDSIKMKTIDDLCWEFLYSDPIKSKEYAYQYIELSELNNDKKNLSTAYSNLAISHHVLGEFNCALEYYDLSLILGREINNKSAVKANLSNIASLELTRGNFIIADSLIVESRALCLELKDTISFIKSYINESASYMNQAEYKKALTLVIIADSLNLALNSNDSFLKSFIHGNIGALYFELADYKKAEIYLNSAIELMKASNNLSTLNTVMVNLSGVHINLKQFDMAESILDQVDTTSIFGIHLYYFFRNKAKIFYISRSTIKEEYYLKKALDVSIREKLKLEKAFSQCELAELYSQQGHVKKAEKFFDKAHQELIDLNYDSTRTYANLLKSYLVHRTKNNLMIDELDLQTYLMINDSLFNAESLAQFSEMESKYENQKKKQQIIILKQESELKDSSIKRKNSYLISITLSSVCLLIALYLLILKRKKEKELYELSVTRLKKDNTALITKNLNLKADRKAVNVNTNETFQIKDQDIEFLIKDIVFIKSDKNYIDLFVNGQRRYITLRYSLQDFIKDYLHQESFIRTHRSYIVQTSKIENLRADKLTVIFNNEIMALPVGRKFKESARHSYNNLAAMV